MNEIVGHPRQLLAITPSPLQHAPSLSDHLGVDIWFKRDDLLGLGLGGNKARPLEFLMGQAVAEGCDVLVTGSGPQSNWSMLAAVAARHCDMDAVVCLYGDRPAQAQGNLVLQTLVGTELHWTGNPERTSVDAMIEVVADDLRSRGRTPFVIPRGGATAVGSLGYVVAAEEIAAQCADRGILDATVWLATGSCGTQGGLVAGVAAGWLSRVVGTTVSRSAAECRERVLSLALGAGELAGTPSASARDVHVVDGYIAPGYGYASAEGAAAAALALRTEGVFLDPPFGAKALAALVDAAREGRVEGPVVFLVSGGAPTLFVKDGSL